MAHGGLSRQKPIIREGPELKWGHAVSQLVEALRYKPEGHGFDSR
jgi:hypothetical protein